MEVQEASPARSPRAAVLSILRSKCIKHFDFVHEYLALLAWNRCILTLVCLSKGKCTVRTTIDTLMTRGFSRLHLVWVWIYVVIITSLAAAAVRWSVKAAINQERANAERRFAQGTNANVSSSQASLHDSATAAATAYRGKFRHNLYKKIAAAFTYVCMWAWAVAALGTLPNDSLWEDALSVVALSLLFAWAMKAGERGAGPLRGLLRRERPRYTQPLEGTQPRVGPYDDAGEDVSDVVRLGVARCCEWILAIAWVGTMRHAVDVAVASATGTTTSSSAAAWNSSAAWITAAIAMGGRAAFVVFRVGDPDEARDGGDSSKATYAALLPEGATSDANVDDPNTANTPDTPTNPGKVGTRAAARGITRLGSHAVFRLEPGFRVAAGARDMLSSAFAYTTGVALNAAAQYTWLGLSEGSMGATASAMMYASVWSLGTIAAASYGAVCRAGELDGGMIGGGRASGFSGGFFAPPADERARGLVTRLCDEEEKVGAFVAGFVWNTAMMLWIGFENEERYRWTLALAITMFSAAVNLFAERAEEAEEDGGDEDEES